MRRGSSTERNTWTVWDRYLIEREQEHVGLPSWSLDMKHGRLSLDNDLSVVTVGMESTR